ncbi:lysine exporter LysO family protein [Porphyromonas pogonae]|uniref:lysine exporter LysO family protein n=1 Tax=Porphyromonas pogonae TaxID=867595 RepID=UPI002E79D6EB|nr:lysine exporter LysO family protein [Porphyromonas pogonae]
MKSSVITALMFIAGLVLGGMGNVIPPHVIPDKLSFYLLCFLLLFVGVSIGSDERVIGNFRNFQGILLLLPFATMAGTLLGSAVVSLLLPHRSITECLAVGSGFGYYSLSGIIITEYKGAELGATALLSNVIREIFALLGPPLFIKYFGKLAPIAVGGATSMDTTLPIILKFSGKDVLLISIIHGITLDFSVPFLVNFFCSF